MKRLNKLKINHNRLIKGDELKTIKGGYGICTCECHRGQGVPLGYLVTYGDNCYDACEYAYVPPYEKYDVGGSPVSPGCW